MAPRCKVHEQPGPCASSSCELGIAQAGGAEAIVHAARTYLHQHPSGTAIQIDVKNAFGTINRNAVRLVARQYPELHHFVEFLYSQPSTVTFSQANVPNVVVASTEGVKHCDPLGGLCFALCMAGALQRTRADFPSCRILSYYDDMTILATNANAAKGAFNRIRELGALIGLQLQPRKCVMLDRRNSHTLLAEQLDIKHEPQGILVCGSAVGNDDYVHARAAGVFEQATTIAGALVRTADVCDLNCPDLEPRHSLIVALRECVATRANHILRTTPRHLLRQLPATFDRALADALFLILNCSWATLSPQQLGAETGPGTAIPGAHDQLSRTTAAWMLRMPIKWGGMGKPNTELIADAAFIGSIALTGPLVLQLLDQPAQAAATLSAARAADQSSPT